MIKKGIFSLFAVLFSMPVAAVTHTISSPDGKLFVRIHDDNGQPTYTVSYAGKQMLTPSALGITSRHWRFYTLANVERNGRNKNRSDLFDEPYKNFKGAFCC